MAAPAEMPAWAGFFIDLLHPSSLICGVAFPVIRASVLKMHRLPVSTGMWIEAGASGLSFPSFVALAASIAAPQVRAHLDAHALALAGFIGVIYTVGSLIKVEREEQYHSRFR